FEPLDCAARLDARLTPLKGASVRQLRCRASDECRCTLCRGILTRKSEEASLGRWAVRHNPCFGALRGRIRGVPGIHVAKAVDVRGCRELSLAAGEIVAAELLNFAETVVVAVGHVRRRAVDCTVAQASEVFGDRRTQFGARLRATGRRAAGAAF